MNEHRDVRHPSFFRMVSPVAAMRLPWLYLSDLSLSSFCVSESEKYFIVVVEKSSQSLRDVLHDFVFEVSSDFFPEGL